MNIGKTKLSGLIIVPVIIGIIVTMSINGLQLIQGDPEIVGKFMNFYTREPQLLLPSYSSAVLVLTGILQIVTAQLLILSLIKFEFERDKESKLIKWGLFMGILSLTFYGFAVRMISNHQPFHPDLPSLSDCLSSSDTVKGAGICAT